MASDEQIAAIREELESLVARLDDLILETLSEAVERGEQRRPELERRLTNVRNALIRAGARLGEA